MIVTANDPTQADYVIAGWDVTFPTTLCDFPSEQKWRRGHQVKCCYLCERFGKARAYE